MSARPKPSASLSKKRKTYRGGLFAETMAAAYLRYKGYRILEMRYKTKFGEIDIIAASGGALIAVEVKRRAEINDALHAVTPKSRKRIQRALLHYVANSYGKHESSSLRFDVIAISLNLRYGWFPIFRLSHVDNAWRPKA